MESKPINETSADLLVVGGGIAGVTAAVEAAETGKSVILIEKEHSLGGRVVQMDRYFPKMCPPVCGMEINFRRLRENPRIQVLTGTTATKIDGDAGSYIAEVNVAPRYVNENCTSCGDCEAVCSIEVDNPFNFGLNKVKAIRLPHNLAFPNRYFVEQSAVNDPAMQDVVTSCSVNAIDLDMKPQTLNLNVKSVVWATGWQPYDANNLSSELSFGKLPNIVTNMMMERMKAMAGEEGKITRPSDSGEIKTAAFVQCAGSRDENHLPYCSAICCMASLKQSRYLREHYPECEIHIFFIDARTPGRWEDFYQEVQDDPKTIIHRGKVADIQQAGDGMVKVTAENTLTGKLEQVDVDLAILATGMKPNNSFPVDLNADEYGFISGVEGMYSTGVAAGPKDVAGSVQEATGAAMKTMKHSVRG